MGQVLYEADAPIEHVYFIQRGVASLVAPVDYGERGWERVVEVGTIGNEGMVGLPLVLGADREPVRAFVQVPDGAWRMSAGDLLRDARRPPRRCHRCRRDASEAGLIRYVRGDITIVDRAGLESASCPCYATIRDSYERLLG